MWYRNGPLPYALDDHCMQVPEDLCPLDESGLSEFHPPSTHSDYWGIEVYQKIQGVSKQPLF